MNKLLFIFAIFGVGYYVGPNLASKFSSTLPYKIERSNNLVTISGVKKNSAFTYRLGRELEITTTVYDAHDERPGMFSGENLLNVMGVQSSMAYLSDRDFKTYKAEYESQNKCPSQFLTEHASSLMLMGDDSNLLKKAANLKKGSKVTLIGQYMNYQKGTYDGYPFEAPQANFKYLWIKDIRG